jgi:hypothetical protein
MISSNYFNECNAVFPCDLDTAAAGLTPLELSLNDWNSLYIPIIPNNLALMNSRGETHRFYPKHLSYFFEKMLNLGKVRRIDYIDRNIENNPTPVKGAFIHFDYWYDNQNARNMRNTLNTTGSGRIGGYENGRNHLSRYYGFSIYGKSGYLDVKINHKPIQNNECDRNIHQLLSDTNRLESEVIAKNNRIACLEKELDNIKKMLYALSHDNILNTSVNEADMTIYPELKK